MPRTQTNRTEFQKEISSIPLHKPKCVGLYHQQLSYCIIQYVEKDADTATPILNGFFKCWPWSCSGKQVLFLNELEEILELLGADQLAQISRTLFVNLARCLDSDHFQVVERALFLWNNGKTGHCLFFLQIISFLPSCFSLVLFEIIKPYNLPLCRRTLGKQRLSFAS